MIRPKEISDTRPLCDGLPFQKVTIRSSPDVFPRGILDPLFTMNELCDWGISLSRDHSGCGSQDHTIGSQPRRSRGETWIS